MVLGRFAIFLDNADATYFAGQEITGKVHIWNEAKKNVKGNCRPENTFSGNFIVWFVLGIYVECRGVARVDFAKQEPKWRTIRRRGRSSHRELSYVTVHHKSFEEYFYQRVILKDGGT